jgi:SAM-dependent methyltransferase
LAVVALLSLVPAPLALAALSALGLAGAAVAAWQLGLGPRALRLSMLLLPILPFLLPSAWMELRLSPYKALSEQLEVSGARVVAERSSPLGWIAVVESPRVPLRYAPGLSLNATAEPPEQLGLFTDGDGPSVITRYRGDRDELAYLDGLTSALAYHLLDRPRTLVLGAGGGADVLQALYYGAREVDAVELNGQVVELVRETFADFAGHLYERPDVRVYTDEARGFLASTNERYELIQVSLLDSFSASAAGLYALNESYLYTVEALEGLLRHLEPGGVLSITRWMKLPPRDSLKLFATAVDALRRLGVGDPGGRLALVRGWRTVTLVVKNGELAASEIESIRRFCADRSFDLAYYPGIRPEEANQYNVLERPYLYEGARAILGQGRERFFDAYKFDLRPATDERPYFFHFFKWRLLPETLAMRGRGGLPLLEWGYLVLVATLLQAALAAAVFIVLPLALRYRWGGRESAGMRRRVVLYFFAIGLAFLFLEMVFIQRLTLFLHHPTYAVAVVLCGFLLFSGLGSAWSGRRLEARGGEEPERWIRRAVLAIAAVGGLYLLVLPPLLAALAHLGEVSRILISLALIAPLAFAMGMPFPLGMSALRTSAPQMIPWAWGINGSASVLSAILATLLAIEWGFPVVVLAAIALYGLAALTLGRPRGAVETGGG